MKKDCRFKIEKEVDLKQEKVIAKAGIISIVYRFEGDLMLADPVTPIKQYQNLTEELVTTEKQLSLKIL